MLQNDLLRVIKSLSNYFPARQLGDIRPLVENGEELTYVAKGLLDTVVGRLSEEGQLNLLQSRKVDLNTMITERAYVSCI